MIRLNFLGDWGTQFGLLLRGIEARNVDLSTDLGTDPFHSLYDIYVDANKLAEGN